MRRLGTRLSYDEYAIKRKVTSPINYCVGFIHLRRSLFVVPCRPEGETRDVGIQNVGILISEHRHRCMQCVDSRTGQREQITHNQRGDVNA